MTLGTKTLSSILVCLGSVWGLALPSFGDSWGSPGLPLAKPSPLKQAVGTALGASSPVWFSVSNGLLSEVYFPTPETPQLAELQFLVTDGKTFLSQQKTDTTSVVTYLNEGLSVQISGVEKAGRYTYTQIIVADPSSPVIRIRTHIKKHQAGLRLYIHAKPASYQKGSQPRGFAAQSNLSFQMSPKIHSTLISSIPWSRTTAGYLGFSDGEEDLTRNFKLTQIFTDAGPGNIGLTGEIPLIDSESEITFDLALAFGASPSEAQAYAQTSLTIPFDSIRSAYENGWKSYIQTLLDSPLMRGKRFLNESTFARRSAQIIKVHEDKNLPGAIFPALGHTPPSSQTLYHAAMGLLAAGDVSTPIHVLKHLGKIKDSSPTRAALFILLAGQLQYRGVYSLGREDREILSQAIHTLLNSGPASSFTELERWEELKGASPGTLAIEIAALKMASLLELSQNRSPQAKGLLQTAEQWQSRVESWTWVSKGPLGKDYYLRLSPNGRPDEPETITLANEAGKVVAAEMIDSSFLDLVRYKIRKFDDPRILNALQLYDSPQMGLTFVDTEYPQATLHRRYNGDVLGPGRIGGVWPLLSAERGLYSVAAGNLERARSQLFVLEKSARPNHLLGEQIGFGAAPFVWAHAEDILLHRSIEEGSVFDSPPTDQALFAPPRTSFPKVFNHVF